MAEHHEVVKVIDDTANPAPLGLMGFGLTTLLLNLHNAGLFGFDSMVMAMGLFFGGMAQVITGAMEWKKKNMFGTVAFSSYGFFWIVLVVNIILQKIGWGETPSPAAMGSFLLVWGLLSTTLFICTLKHGKAMQILFGMVVILFFILSIASFTESHMLHTIAGFEGIACGAFAMYCASALLINDSYKETVLPL